MLQPHTTPEAAAGAEVSLAVLAPHSGDPLIRDRAARLLNGRNARVGG